MRPCVAFNVRRSVQVLSRHLLLRFHPILLWNRVMQIVVQRNVDAAIQDQGAAVLPPRMTHPLFRVAAEVGAVRRYAPSCAIRETVSEGIRMPSPFLPPVVMIVAEDVSRNVFVAMRITAVRRFVTVLHLPLLLQIPPRRRRPPPNHSNHPHIAPAQVLSRPRMILLPDVPFPRSSAGSSALSWGLPVRYSSQCLCTAAHYG